MPSIISIPVNSININTVTSLLEYYAMDKVHNISDIRSVTLVKAKFFNVKNYGAKGDGITDDTQAIRNALKDAIQFTYTNSRYAVVYFPSGTYLTDTLFGALGFPWNVPYRYLVLKGEGDSSVLLLTSQNDKPVTDRRGLIVIEGGRTFRDIIIRDLVLDGNKNYQDITPVINGQLSKKWLALIRLYQDNARWNEYQIQDITLDNVTIRNGIVAGIELEGIKNVKVLNSRITDNGVQYTRSDGTIKTLGMGDGIYATGGPFEFINLRILHNTDTAISIEGMFPDAYAKVINCAVTGDPAVGIALVYGNTHQGLHGRTAAHDVLVSGCTLNLRQRPSNYDRPSRGIVLDNYVPGDPSLPYNVTIDQSRVSNVNWEAVLLKGSNLQLLNSYLDNSKTRLVYITNATKVRLKGNQYTNSPNTVVIGPNVTEIVEEAFL